MLRMMRVHRALAGAIGALGLVACSAAAADPPASTVAETTAATELPVDTDPSVPSTIGGVGNLPGALPTAPVEQIEAAAPTTFPPPPEKVGLEATGNRLLLIGDSILASTARRYTNNMCATLVPLGWQVEVEAEVSRGIAFGQQVLRRVGEQRWDVGLVFLGNNYGGDENDFFARYNDVIVRFGEIPVVVVTVSEVDEYQARVNFVIRQLAAAHPNVTVLDWAQISTYPGVIASGDGLKIHLSNAGRQVLADAVANVLGAAPAAAADGSAAASTPVAPEGTCLKSVFTDDSAGSVNGGQGSTTRPPTTSRPTQTTSRTTQTTSRPAPTSGGGGTTATTSGGCQIPPCGTNAPASTNPPTGSTRPPTASTNPSTGSTSPAATNPPASPQPTSPPATNPPPASGQPPPP